MITTIALTGGPCGGKTSALEAIKTSLNCSVVAVPEAASQIIATGLIPGQNGLSKLDFQRLVFKRQLELETEAQRQAQLLAAMGDDVLVVLDRSLFDQLAYVSETEFQGFLDEAGLNEHQVIKRYDMIIHLVSAAVGTSFYTTTNNACRLETAAEAIAVEERTWVGNQHFPDLVVVDNTTGFDEKLARVVATVKQTLVKAA